MELITYKNQKFIIENDQKEYKGTIFTNTHSINESSVNNILEKIREEGKLFEKKPSDKNLETKYSERKYTRSGSKSK